jgi:outer membrane protein TolC
MKPAVLALASLFVLSAALMAAAQSGPSPAATSTRLTLADALAEAEANAPAIKVAAGQRDAATWRATAASRSRFGQADLVVSYSRYQDDQILRPMASELFGPQGLLGLPFDRDQLHYGIVYQVPLYAGGRLDAANRSAVLQADQAALLVQGTRWEVRAAVESLYAATVSLDAWHRAVQGTREALEATRRRLALAVEQGKRPRLDLLKVEEELADAVSRDAQVSAEASRTRALLLAAIGRDPSATVDLEPLPDAEPQAVVPEKDLVGLVRGSSVVSRGSSQVAQAEQATRIARAALLPSVSVRGNLMGNNALGLDQRMATWEFSVGVTMPVFSAGARQADVATARAQERASRAAADRTALDRRALLVEAQARLRAAVEAWRAAHARVGSAKEAARIEQIRYDSGASTVEDLLRARAREEAAAAALAQARGDMTAAAGRLNAVCETEVVK